MHRGEVWWGVLPAPVGPRPVAIITRERGVAVRNSVTVAILTTRVRGLPTEVALSKTDGLAKDCVINADNILTVEKPLLTRRLAVLSQAKLAELERAVRFSLGLD
ncbi:MAG: type II toxin-antitoxin system PemK/MazF family toxin [Elusimicrobia bacterium]|nr:type II toxin-antitoxin system PemK/MazF family toxin [Elusimicrobiota bacterium]